MMPSPEIAREPETVRIADQLRRMYYGPAWHGPALTEVLEGLSESQAAARPLTYAHSIWELVLHTTAWLRITRERLSATKNVEPTSAENWPAVTGSWMDARAGLESEYRKLEDAIRALEEQRLDAPAPATEPQTFYILLHGAIQHIAYHTGQIVLLKKATQEH